MCAVPPSVNVTTSFVWAELRGLKFQFMDHRFADRLARGCCPQPHNPAIGTGQKRRAFAAGGDDPWKNPPDLRTVVPPEGEIRSGQMLPGTVVCFGSVPPTFDQPEQAVVDLAISNARCARSKWSIASRRFESASEILRSPLSCSRFVFRPAIFR